MRVAERPGATDEAPAPRRRGRLDFVWVCRRRGDAKALAAALEATTASYRIIARVPRLGPGGWAGPRWVVHGWGLSRAELDALQRLAPRIDPSAAGAVWDAVEQRYR